MSKNTRGFSALEAIIVLFVLTALVGITFIAWDRFSGSAANVPAKRQYANANLAVGYTLVNTSKFQRVDKSTKYTAMLASVYKTHDNVNTVLFEGNDAGFNDSSLYLYDLSANAIYKIASGGSDAARIMSDHYVVYGFGEQHSDGTTNSVIVLNLQTGEKKTIVEGNAMQLTGNDCCAVSPDGLKLAIPEKNKVLVWNLADGSTRYIPATLNPFSEGFPTDPAFFKAAPYFEEISYPNLAWVNNTSLVYVDHPPIIMNADNTNTPSPNRLYLLDTDSEVSTPFQDVNAAFYDVTVTNNGQTIIADNLDDVYKFDVQTHEGTPVAAGGSAQWRMYSADGSTVYAFTGGVGSENTFSFNVDTAEKNGLNLLLPEFGDVSYARPESWIGDHLLLVKLAAYNANPSQEWEVVYDTAADKVVQSVRVN